MSGSRNLIPHLLMAVFLAGGWWLIRPRAVALPDTGLVFTEISAPAGASNVHRPCILSERFANIMPWLTGAGAAVAAGDFDGDGWVDFYVTNSGRGVPNRLFRNRGDGTFTDVASRAGVAACNDEGATMDAAFLDYDNDGDQDLYVARWGAGNLLFENRGDGTFRERSREAGADVWGYPNGVLVFDHDRDGLPDILLAHYFAAEVEDPQSGRIVRNDLWNPVTTRVMHETTTSARNGGSNVLLHNRGDGRFVRAETELGLVETGWSLDAGAGDLDNDGWPDLYVANDYGPDDVYLNEGGTRFVRIQDGQGRPGIGRDWWKGMNVDLADVDGNGYLDIYVANILVPGHIVEGNMLWMGYPDPRRPGGVRHDNLGEKTGTMDGGWGWGARFGDFNNDGLCDLLAVNGFVSGGDPRRQYWFALQELSAQHKGNIADAANWLPMEDLDLAGHQSSRLFLQAPGLGSRLPRFVDAAASCGLTDRHDGRGVALADIDRDGDLDVYVANQNGPSCLYRNDGTPGPGARWLGVLLEGDPAGRPGAGGRILASSRDAWGARVTVHAGMRRWLQEVAAANGFSSQSQNRLHFGLGPVAAVDSVVVRWPSGLRESAPGHLLTLDRDYRWREGRIGAELGRGLP
ncbi:MAG: CRTAC1 family protein [bacterium]